MIRVTAAPALSVKRVAVLCLAAATCVQAFAPASCVRPSSRISSGTSFLSSRLDHRQSHQPAIARSWLPRGVSSAGDCAGLHGAPWRLKRGRTGVELASKTVPKEEAERQHGRGVPSTSFAKSYSKPTWQPSATTDKANDDQTIAPATADAPAAVAAADLGIVSGSTAAGSMYGSKFSPETSTAAGAKSSDAAAAPAAVVFQSTAPGDDSAKTQAGDEIDLTLERAKEELESLTPLRKKIQSNIADGTVGERGEEWALAQALILACIVAGTVPLVGGLFTFLAGPGVMIGGVVVGAAGVRELGGSLSPWPAPTRDNELRTDGIFGVVRHPTYLGVVMFCFGLGVITNSPSRLLLAALLAVVLDKKAGKEEGMLAEVHGEDDESYRNAVAKFIPRYY